VTNAGRSLSEGLSLLWFMLKQSFPPTFFPEPIVRESVPHRGSLSLAGKSCHHRFPISTLSFVDEEMRAQKMRLAGGQIRLRPFLLMLVSKMASLKVLQLKKIDEGRSLRAFVRCGRSTVANSPLFPAKKCLQIWYDLGLLRLVSFVYNILVRFECSNCHRLACSLFL